MNGSEHPVLDEHRQVLRAAFLEWLLSKNPTQVLDLGAGDGTLVSDLNDSGVSATGIEQRGPSLERARQEDIPVGEGLIDGPTTAFPSSEWITVRHVLHHVDDPARVLLRASAAAEVGILAAEPLTGDGFPRFEWMRRLDNLTRGLDRKSGMIHGPDLTASELASMMPSDWSIEIRAFAPMTTLPAGEVKVLIDRAARSMPLDDGDSKEKDMILAAARAGLLSASGSVVVMATRGSE